MSIETNKRFTGTEGDEIEKEPKPSESELSVLLYVPVVELAKLEKSRVDLYDFLEGKLSEWQMMQVINITGQIWKVANKKKWGFHKASEK